MTPTRALKPQPGSALRVFDEVLMSASSPPEPPFCPPHLSPLSPEASESTPPPAPSPPTRGVESDDVFPGPLGRRLNLCAPTSGTGTATTSSASNTSNSLHLSKAAGTRGKSQDAVLTLGGAMVRLQKELYMLGRQLNNAPSNAPPPTTAPTTAGSTASRPTFAPASSQTAPLPRGRDAWSQARPESKQSCTQTEPCIEEEVSCPICPHTRQARVCALLHLPRQHACLLCTPARLSLACSYRPRSRKLAHSAAPCANSKGVCRRRKKSLKASQETSPSSHARAQMR